MDIRTSPCPLPLQHESNFVWLSVGNLRHHIYTHIYELLMTSLLPDPPPFIFEYNPDIRNQKNSKWPSLLMNGPQLREFIAWQGLYMPVWNTRRRSIYFFSFILFHLFDLCVVYLCHLKKNRAPTYCYIIKKGGGPVFREDLY